jgi:transcriptional regulator with XRE-family HTH domain
VPGERKQMKKQYVSLQNEAFDLESLSGSEKDFLRKAMDFYAKRPDWNEFSNYYTGDICRLYGSLPRKEISKKPIYKICLDLEMRLGIEQGQTRLPDYRDALEEIIDSEFGSRYQFCKKASISQDTLSRILNKKREPSVDLLVRILDSLGYELAFQRKQSPQKDKPSKQTASAATV